MRACDSERTPGGCPSNGADDAAAMPVLGRGGVAVGAWAGLPETLGALRAGGNGRLELQIHCARKGQGQQSDYDYNIATRRSAPYGLLAHMHCKWVEHRHKRSSWANWGQ
jgi:hypothetical protein